MDSPSATWEISRLRDGKQLRRAVVSAFTLIELLVAMAVSLLLLLVMLSEVVGFASAKWRTVSDKSKSFEDARVAFDTITRSLSQAMLGTYLEYYDANGVPFPLASNTSATNSLVSAFRPAAYGRFSYLHFVAAANLVPGQKTHAVFFQSPLDFSGTGSAGEILSRLNAVGYYIEYANDSADRPPEFAAGSKKKYRLMQTLQRTQNLEVFSGTSRAWIDAAVSQSRLLAENVICLIVWPKKPDEEGAVTGANLIAPNYTYDTRGSTWSSVTTGSRQPIQMHQLPPTVRLLMVAIEESSAARLDGTENFTAGLFTNPANYQSDLDTLETNLRNAHMGYRIFQSDVPIRAAKWSE